MRIQALLPLYVFLIAAAAFVIAGDAKHPEQWDTFYRNPWFSIPFCLACVAFFFASMYWQHRKQQRMSEGMRLLEEADRLLDQGFEEEGDAAYAKGCWLCGIRRRL